MGMYEPTDTRYYTASGRESANDVKYDVYDRDVIEAWEAFADHYQVPRACNASYPISMFISKSRQELEMRSSARLLKEVARHEHLRNL
jgi:hypothetical protein